MAEYWKITQNEDYTIVEDYIKYFGEGVLEYLLNRKRFLESEKDYTEKEYRQLINVIDNYINAHYPIDYDEHFEIEKKM